LLLHFCRERHPFPWFGGCFCYVLQYFLYSEYFGFRPSYVLLCQFWPFGEFHESAVADKIAKCFNIALLTSLETMETLIKIRIELVCPLS